MKRKTENSEIEEVLSTQIPEYETDIQVHEKEDTVDDKKPKKLSYNPSKSKEVDEQSYEEFSRKSGIGSLGGSISKAAEVRNGWMPVDRALLGDRNMFYPEDWQFSIRPATVEAIRNWSVIDENNGNSIDDVFNEILKYCLSIKTNTGVMPYQAINSWDRFFFVLLIREYTFINGESKIEYTEPCPNCDSDVVFTLNSQALMYDMPDESVYKYYDPTTRTWVIDPADFGVPSNGPITLYVPTIEKDANIKQWIIGEYNENEKKKFDQVFHKFLPWLCPKISKDFNIARTQIRKAEMVFKSWDTEMFSFMDDVIRNIIVMPSMNISAVCPSCGEVATSKIRFPNGIGSLFNVVNKHSKFGTK